MDRHRHGPGTGHAIADLLADPLWEPQLYGTPQSRLAVRITLIAAAREVRARGLAAAGFDEAIACVEGPCRPPAAAPAA